MPRILIAGAGVAGSYLWRLLTKRGMNPHEIEIVDPGHRTHCGIAPCCFGTTKHFFSLCQDVGLEPEKYILRSIDSGYLDSLKLNLQGYAFVIDKPAFINDLLSGANVLPQPSDSTPGRIIDATGIARAYIGKSDSDLLVACLQRKIQFPKMPVAKEFLHHVGVSWVIPLEDSSAHVGVASYTYDLHKMKETIDTLAEGGKTICGCQGHIRNTGLLLPLVRGRVWAVGEAGGIIDPLTALGIVPAMVSVKLLVEHWDDAAKYEAAVVKRYGWFKKTTNLIRTLRETNVFKIWDLDLIKKYADFIGFEPGVTATYRHLVPTMLQLPSVLQLLRSVRRG